MERTDPTAKPNTAAASQAVAYITNDSTNADGSREADSNTQRRDIRENTPSDIADNDQISPVTPQSETTDPSTPIAATKQYPAPFSGFASEPKPLSSNRDLEEYEPGSNSFPSLRFPRPLGNRQLTNWVSSSSPDIMDPGNIPEVDDAKLLGYDIITTDGESQAESTTSSTDYQRPDDIQSLVGTDTGTDVGSTGIDSDSSEDEDDSEQTLNDHTGYSTESWVVQSNELSGLDPEEVDYDSQANQSLEIPTTFRPQQTPIINRDIPPKQLVDDIKDIPTEIQPFESLGEPNSHTKGNSPDEVGKKKPQRLGWSAQAPSFREAYNLVYQYPARALLLLCLFFGQFYVSLIAHQFIFQSPTAHELATVPVASVSSGGPLLVVTSASSTQPLDTLKPSGLPDIAKPTTDDVLLTQPARCSAERFGRNEILVRVNQAIKTSWMAKDALLIAVSRSNHDVPTVVSSVDEGILLKLPTNEAHGTLDVTIATTRKPKIQEFYQVSFGGRFVFDEAFDAGKQLVRDFAQRFVDTVNTTAWGEETSIPGFDTISKQVCSQTASVSDRILQRIGDFNGGLASASALVASRLRDRAQELLNKEPITKRALQVQLEAQRQLDDTTAELRLGVLAAQLSSKLWWLRVQGKSDEAQDYLKKAEAFYQEKERGVWAAQRERAARVKETIQNMWAPKHSEPNYIWRKGTGGL